MHRAHRGAYLVYRSIGGLLQAFPQPLAAAVATMSGLAMSELSPRTRLIVRANLRRVLGPTCSRRELDRAVVQAYESYARYWVESARLAGMRPAQLMERFSLEGYEHIEAAPGRGGAILALPHLGSWEVGGYWFSLLGRPITTVAEPVEPPELFEWVTKQRSLLGLNILPLEKESVGELAHTIRQGGIVALVADRDIVGNGVGVRFFGDMTTLPAGPAVLALRTGAPLLPVAVYQRPRGRYHGVVRPALQATRAGRFRDDVKALTQQLADEFERLIRDAPTQWHMFQPNWPPER